MDAKDRLNDDGSVRRVGDFDDGDAKYEYGGDNAGNGNGDEDEDGGGTRGAAESSSDV